MRTIRLCLAALTITSAGTAAFAETSPSAALARLERGNHRAASGEYKHPNLTKARRLQVAKGQSPVAVIVSCSDSRVPPELVFDQGLGDLFVIRVAGNVVDSTALGSIEYAVEHLRAPLIVVMGHERCGAVSAAVEGGEAPGHLGSVVAAIRPAVEETAGAKGDRIDAAVRANIRRVVAQIRESEPILDHAADEKKINVIGMIYDLDTGRIEKVK